MLGTKVRRSAMRDTWMFCVSRCYTSQNMMLDLTWIIVSQSLSIYERCHAFQTKAKRNVTRHTLMFYLSQCYMMVHMIHNSLSQILWVYLNISWALCFIYWNCKAQFPRMKINENVKASFMPQLRKSAFKLR